MEISTEIEGLTHNKFGVEKIVKIAKMGENIYQYGANLVKKNTHSAPV